MDKIFLYVKKNAVFVFLLATLFIIIITLLILYNPFKNAPSSPLGRKEQPTKLQEKDDNIALSFEGNTNKDSSIYLYWNLNVKSHKINSVYLYHGETMIADVTTLSSYTLPQDVYRFTGDHQLFTIKVNYDDNQEITADKEIYVVPILSKDFSLKQEDEKIYLSLTYTYQKNSKIDIPHIKIANAPSYDFTVDFVNNDKTEKDGITTAVTTYVISSNQFKQGEYTLKFRWIFNSISTSYDFDQQIIIPDAQK